MTGADYEIMLKNPAGQAIAILDDFVMLDSTRSVGAVGTTTISVPWNKYPNSFFPVDGIIEIWRQPQGFSSYLEGETIWFIRKTRKALSEQGEWVLELTAVDTIDIINRRIVAYTDMSSYAVMTTYADDLMKAFWRSNAGDLAVDPTRNLLPFISTDPYFSMGPSLTKTAAWRNLLTTLSEIDQAAFSAGIYTTYDIISNIPASGISLQFKTYTGQRGKDHRQTSTAPVILDPERYSISAIENTFDATQLANFIYAGGEGADTNKIIQSGSDPASIGLSPFNRCEYYQDVPNGDTAAKVLTGALDQLRSMRLRRMYSAKVTDTPAMQYGVQYKYGDFLTCGQGADAFDARLNAVNIHIENKEEAVAIMLRSD